MKYTKYLALIIVIAALFASCEKDDTSVIDPVKTFPKILGTLITPSSYDTSSINGIAWAEVTSDELVTKVQVTVKDPQNSQNGVFILHDDGVAPDTAAGDGKYAGYISFTLQCYLIGTYKGEFVAYNVSGLNSSLISENFTVTNSHSLPPVLSNIVAPDSLLRPSGIGADTVRFASLEVTAADPDGQCDIKSDGVFFNSFKPNGDPSTGNPFTMYDDGNTPAHCDNVADDGKFSLCIRLVNNPNGPFPPPDLGPYIFKFNARDRSDILSDTLFHTIYVYQ